MSVKPFSLYVHVPFCSQKCPYCDFNTYATARIPELEYVSALGREIDKYASDPRFQGRQIGSVFFGGGTPSLLSGEAIGRIVSSADARFKIVPGAEITLEANPNNTSLDRIASFRQAGVNRISFGVQSFSPERLSLLGRDHSADEAERAIYAAHEAGISNISLDLICGVPGQNLGDLQQDLEQALKLPIAHISTYALTIEPGTPFFQRQERGLLAMPSDELVAEMLVFIPEFLEARGFFRYEISNYARPGSESVHNQAYWIGDDYLGIGAGAHSYCGEYDGGILRFAERWSTLALPDSYMKAVVDSSAISWRERISSQSLKFEFFYVGLRMMRGVSKAEFCARFGEALDAVYGDVVTELAREGYLEVSADRIWLTKRGILVADSVFERFITPEVV